MNLTHKRIAEIRNLVSAGIQLGRTEAEDLLGHNDHMAELCEARARLVLRAESESETLRGLYQMHKHTEAREMRELKAELVGLKTGYEAYERLNAELRAECEALRNNQSFSDAFYEVSGLLGVTGARPEAPLVVFRQEVVPALQAVIRNSRRYEWLRAETGDGPNIQVSEWIGPHEYRLFGEELDQAIDQHLSQEAAQ